MATKKFDKFLDRATDSTNFDPAWENILICVDSVKSGDISPKIALECLRRKYRLENPHVVHHALLVLEALVKNCGEKMHKEIACQDFMQDLKRLAQERQDEKIKEKILQLIQCWSHAFRKKPEYKIVVDTHNLMKLEGYTFAPMRESDAMFDAESAPEWFDSDKCHRCSAEFGFFTRKHHCRNCGQVFCDKCSSKNISLPHIGIEADVRVCETCFDKLKNKSTASTVKPNLVDVAKKVDKEVDSKGPSSKMPSASSAAKAELDDEEELQLALAISQSEAEEKERQKQRQLFNFYGGTFAPETPSAPKTKVPQESLGDKNSTGYLGTLEKSPATVNNTVENDEETTDGELAKYLNRGYWEARRSEHKRGILRQSPTPSAPPAVPVGDQIPTDVVLNGKGPENGVGDPSNGANGVTSPEFTDFVEKLRLGVEIFVNRIRNDVARGRPIITDSSVQSMFVNLTAMHAQLLQHMSALDDRRGFYESLQDKLAQIKDAREAMDSLREEHCQRRQAEVLEVQRQQQAQMACKLDVMRQKKHEMLEQQRLLAMQRIEEQRREMEARRQAQIQLQQQISTGVALPHQQFHQQPIYGQEGVGLNTMHQITSALSGPQMSNFTATAASPSSQQAQAQAQALANHYSTPQPQVTHYQPAFSQQPQMSGLSQASHQQQQAYGNQQAYPQAYATNVGYTVAGPMAPHMQYGQQYGAQQQNLPPAHQQQFSAPQAPYYYQQPDPSTMICAASMAPTATSFVYPSYPGAQVASFPAPFPYYQQHGAPNSAQGAHQPADQAPPPTVQQVPSSTTEGQLISFD